MSTKKTVRRVAAAAVALAAPAALMTAAPAEAAAPGTRSLATVLDADGNRFDSSWKDFDVLDRAVRTVLAAKPNSDVAVLADGTTRLTAFLPTDGAFRRLVADLAGSRPDSERATFRAVKSLGVDTVEAVLLYHVVPGAKITYADAAASDGAILDTASGQHLRVVVRDGKAFLRDEDNSDPNPYVIESLSDINKANRQIGHGINRVLRPADLP